ncbi:MAG: peptidoglycan editing factor PgeF [Phycisphaerales bacterium]|nr:peptidoglycan editing factor PgeF [Planctomycetota bacterium]
MPLVPALITASGARAAFSTRRGGVSGGIFDSLNFGNPSELTGPERDPPENIRANFHILLESAGIPPGGELVQVFQVHGAAVLTVRPGRPAHAGPGDTKADAIVTDDPARTLCIRTADCTPILLASADGKVVGAVHAGWRGVVTDVAGEAVRAMHALGVLEIRASIGPCISFQHFEVGPEVIDQFRTLPGAAWRQPAQAGSKGFVDLQATLHAQLLSAGVTQIETLPLCTYARDDLFFSHRRDKGRTGRMASIITPAR